MFTVAPAYGFHNVDSNTKRSSMQIATIQRSQHVVEEQKNFMALKAR